MTDPASADRSQEQANDVDAAMTRAEYDAAFSAMKEVSLADPARYYFAALYFHEANRYILTIEADRARLQATVAELSAALEAIARQRVEAPRNIPANEWGNGYASAMIKYTGMAREALNRIEAAASADTSANEDARTQGTPDAGGED